MCSERLLVFWRKGLGYLNGPMLVTSRPEEHHVEGRVAGHVQARDGLNPSPSHHVDVGVLEPGGDIHDGVAKRRLRCLIGFPRPVHVPQGTAASEYELLPFAVAQFYLQDELQEPLHGFALTAKKWVR